MMFFHPKEYGEESEFIPKTFWWAGVTSVALWGLIWFAWNCFKGGE